MTKSMFFGRSHELKLLEEHRSSNKAELVIIYGRRRIGKSALIKQFARNKKNLYFEAIDNAAQRQQIEHFLSQLSEQVGLPKFDCKKWKDAFDALTGIIKSGKWIVVFDEFPWMASKKAGLVSLLKYYWDQKWKENRELMLILCGSVASFMVEHIVHSDALHNRKTIEMRLDHLLPADVRSFLGKRSAWETSIVMMMIGGVPKYLEMFDRSLSAKINFNEQFFTKDGFFVNELETIFKEQFRSTAYYEAIVRLLSFGSANLSEIGRKISFESGGTLRKYLKNLEMAGFIEEMPSLSPSGERRRTRKYRLADPFLRTYFRFIEPNKKRIQRNTNAELADSIMGESWDTFFGQAFDWFVYSAAENLFNALKIPPADIVNYGPYFRQKERTGQKRPGVQIDMLVVRRDGVITVIENKFTRQPVGSSIMDEVQSKIDKLDIPKGRTIEKVLVSASGATKTVVDSGYFNKIVTLDELFG